MKNISSLFITAFMFFAITGFSQRIVSPDHYCIYFTDKNDTPYSITKPEAFLSQKSIDRRERYNIEITSQDFPVNPNYVQQISDLGFEIVNVSKWLNCAIVYTENESLLAELENLPFVKKDSKKRKRRKLQHEQQAPMEIKVEKNKEKFKDVYKYGKGKNQIKMLNGHDLHNRGYSGEGMTIAVVDAGFYHVNVLPAFDSLWANKQILGWYDFVDGDTDVWEEDSHGMMVLSIIGANMPGEFVGTAPKADFWLLRSENTNSEYVIEEYNWVCAAEFADSVGVDIIHSSLGYFHFDDDQDYTYKDMDGNTAISTIGSDIAASKGMLINTSAGNSGWSKNKHISVPADADSCLAIGACWRGKVYVGFSSKGPTYDNRIKPNVSAKGAFTTIQTTDGGLGKSFGTSLSGPVVAGLVACLWQAYPELNNMEIIDAVQKTANKYSKPDEKVGYGIPDFREAFLLLKK